MRLGMGLVLIWKSILETRGIISFLYTLTPFLHTNAKMMALSLYPKSAGAGSTFHHKSFVTEQQPYQPAQTF